MLPRVSSRFVVGFVLAVIGAFMAINIVLEVRPPMARTVTATGLFVLGAHLIGTALDRRLRRE